MDAVRLASLGARRTRAGANQPAATDAPSGPRPPTNDYNHDDDDDDDAAPPLPPVSRREQASVIVAAFLAIALTIGYNQSYGVFQEYYLSPGQDVLVHSMKTNTALLAFVGTLGAGLTWAGSLVVNPWLARAEHAAAVWQVRAAPASLPRARRRWPQHHHHYHHLLRRYLHHPRAITLTGVALMAAGFSLASVGPATVTQLLLTQGLLYGAGSALLYFPLLGPAPEYFTRHRATAIGVVLAGGGAGSLVLAPALRALLAAVGGRWTLRFLAVLYLVVGTPVAWAVPRSRFGGMAAAAAAAAAAAVAAGTPGRNPTPPNDTEQARADAAAAAAAAATIASLSARRPRTRLSPALLATPAFLFAVAAAFFQAAGGTLPLTFVPSYSVSLGLSAGTGATLLAVANAVNAVARVAAGYAGDRLGRLNVLVVSLAVAAAAVAALWGLSVAAAAANNVDNTHSTHLWLAFVVLYSIAAGGYYALFPATIADVFGIRRYAAVNGFLYFVRGCGTMLGSPVGGVLLGKDNNNGGISSSGGGGSSSDSHAYADVVVWDGALLAGAAVCVLGVRWADAVRRGWSWRA